MALQSHHSQLTRFIAKAALLKCLVWLQNGRLLIPTQHPLSLGHSSHAGALLPTRLLPQSFIDAFVAMQLFKGIQSLVHAEAVAAVDVEAGDDGVGGV